jgi:PAS domain S-box-containing protein
VDLRRSGMVRSDARTALQAVGLSITVLLVSAIALGAVAWLLAGQARQMLLPILTILVPASLAVAFLVYRQIRTQQATQETLQGVQARASGIAESAMDPIISVDENQRIVLFNAAAERAFRWPRTAVLGQPLDMLLPVRFHAAHRTHVAQFRQTGVTSRRMGGLNALTGVRANGEEFPIEASISQHVEDGRTMLTVILTDITERARSEALLARGEARLRGILDSAMDAIITVDERQKIVLFNAAAEKMFGCPQDQAIGAPLAWFIPDRFRTAHMQHVAQFGATGVVSRRMGGSRVVTGLRRNGEEFPIDASISQLTDGDAKFYTVILRDVSERVRAQQALERSKDELRELASAASSAREQEQSRIARELHDEVAQAMSTLKMDIKLVRQGSPQTDAGLATRLDRMEAQIDATIAAMRRIAADLRPLALDDLGLIPAIESLVHDFERRTRVRCELAVADPELALPGPQATAVFRIVQESLTNVAKHAKASGVEVVIGVEHDAITVTVRDDGVGFSTSEPRKPQSYGLLGVRERAYLLGGDTSIISAPGGGTEIEVRLPRQAATLA